MRIFFNILLAHLAGTSVETGVGQTGVVHACVAKRTLRTCAHEGVQRVRAVTAVQTGGRLAVVVVCLAVITCSIEEE